MPCPTLHLLAPAGYLSLLEVFRLGAIMGLVNLAVWGLTGSVWWAWLGLM